MYHTTSPTKLILSNMSVFCLRIEQSGQLGLTNGECPLDNVHVCITFVSKTNLSLSSNSKSRPDFILELLQLSFLLFKLLLFFLQKDSV